MFVLSKISDLIRIVPAKFDKPTLEAVEDEINGKYANKVVQGVGLCVCVYDVVTIGDGLIRPGDGSSYIRCTFRVIVFRPFVGEVMTGWISSCTEDGIRVRMEFFDEVTVPKEYLFEGCVFVAREQAWVWRTPDGPELYLDTNEQVRFKVEREVFTDQSPVGPRNEVNGDDNNNDANTSAASGTAGTGAGASSGAPRPTPAYAVVGSCQTYGMGLVTWWD
ncbi:RNA polymerase III subunit Rpc25-domain-containing protein [Lipomyces japonicus]|uniref:RNA polymerase III subunit Rpc25-domain-containing protein n=1 Tax=Lipomyces japonicus TaxID=56871 RepID=UPI0034CE29AF